MFDDFLTRGAQGKDRYTGTYVDTPRDLHWYVSGFSCVDQSAENRRHQKPLELEATENSGPSTKTLLATFAYIEAFLPVRFVVENPHRSHTVSIIQSRMRRLPQYMYTMLVINSKVCGVWCSRPRLYIVAINLQKRKVLVPPISWHGELSKIYAQMNERKRPCETYVLPATSPCVETCLQSLRTQRHRNAARAWPLERARHMQIRSDLLKSTAWTWTNQTNCHRSRMAQTLLG